MQLGWDSPFIRRRTSTIFRPEQFVGPQYVPGVDVDADMFALQSCFDAAMNAKEHTGVGVAALGGHTYLNIENGGTFNTWVKFISYSFNCQRSLTIEGEDATIKLARMPNLYPVANSCFNWWHFGTGYDVVADGPLVIGEISDDIWHFTNGYVVRDLNFDTSVLTVDDLIRLTGTPGGAQNVTGSVIEFAGCGFPNAEGDIGAGALLENIHVDTMFGTIGIGCNARSNCLLFDDITVEKVYKVGCWVDGTRNSKIDRVTVLGAHPNADSPQGLGGENNTDCGQGIETTEFTRFNISGMKTSLSFGGIDCEMHHGEVMMPAAGTSLVGALVGSSVNEKGVFPTVGGSMHHINIQRDPATVTASYFAFEIHGSHDNIYGDSPIDGVNIHDNTIGTSPKKIQYAANLGNYVDNLHFNANEYWTTAGDTNGGLTTAGLVFTSGHPEYLTGNDFSGNTRH